MKNRILAFALALSSFALPHPSFAEKPNVLFLAVDDLRPQLACYGETHVKSPNLDRLAAGGVRFDRAYCMVPTCGASRASLFTSCRPAPSRFVTHLAYAEKDAPGITSMHTHFKAHGYTTLSNGKILHHPGDSAAGWSEPAWRPSRNEINQLPDANAGRAGAKNVAKRAGTRGPPYEISALSDDQLPDGEIARKTIADLRRLKEQGRPFFLAAGFMKPHLPFIAPHKYWELYPADTIKLPSNYHPPKDAPDAAIHNSGELRSYAGVPKTGPVSDEMALGLIRGYHACVSFTDAQIGKVLDELDRLGLAQNTIVVLWGDHGWNLGEHALWNKHACFETAMRIPLIVRAPGIAAGNATSGLTESIDIYPALCELAGLPVPAHAQGRSFVPLLKNPALAWKEQAIGRFGWGDTIRTDTHRFTEYRANGGKGDPVAKMLYDHTTDPSENANIARQPANAEAVAQFTTRLNAGKGKDGDLPKRTR